ncbi:serine hydrolase [Pseudomonas daroniae]|uniref:beta-lactamase n=1 Tax=Phytopseudomonas daroniae TaxID=2487519 RepID=A0A4Q9QQE6_9GAMM|nr:MULTISPECIES: serine hydrolase [Pseudomonas]TBU81158.1 serine hydrolase [Pseudomonas daroniae]TBU83683.1 serine hydrolase [Pseudomonas sp. FRB 228]TBU89384.1 serine hydrolase [Pseudomonas daroniae]
MLHGSLIRPLLLMVALLSASAQADSAMPGWQEPLLERLQAVAAKQDGELGVYVKDLHSNLAVTLHAEELWYMASGIKVPVAIAVLRGVERGEWNLDTRLILAANDFVDGAGSTNQHGPGARLSVRFLLEQMIIYSDNTATDRLIRLVGLDAVNRLVSELVSEGFEPITSLADVRHHIYRELHPAAERLGGRDLLRLRQASKDDERLDRLASLLGVPRSELAPISLNTAYAHYYSRNLNAARLSAYGELLERLAEGEALGAEQTTYLLGVMSRVKTGSKRIIAGLPADAHFAHKTGTQRARICDSGLIDTPARGSAAPVLVVACVQGESSLAKAERSLRQVGEALARSGVLQRDALK